jgi:Na+/H+ antiporter NhaD/arsenite permease-like protein
MALRFLDFTAGVDPTLAILGVPFEFVLFAAILVAVAGFHQHTLSVALTGLATIIAYKLFVTGFKSGTGLLGLFTYVGQDWVMLMNLFLLLVGFALLARHFEKTRIPAVLPRFLAHDWKGAFSLLMIVFVLSSFLDNIAAALIGGAMARTLFRAKVHVGYLAAIVAAANAGGAGSVIGDSTTTMMWIDGVSPAHVLTAYVAGAVALIVFGIPAAFQQQRYSPILQHEHHYIRIDWPRVGLVACVLGTAIATNAFVNRFPELSNHFPFIGVAVALVLLLGNLLRRADWEIVPEAARGSTFLVALVLTAAFMPVDKLPEASWQTALLLGFVSAVFDNIPLTALALKQGGHDWGVLAYAVGFGGSMMWFGSSAGVALSNLFPASKSVRAWLTQGWHIPFAYVLGFAALVILVGWNPVS